MTIKIDVEGEEKLIAAIEKYPREVGRNLGAAGKEAANMILDIEGLRRYPPETESNMPPEPYYIRGRGMQYKSKNTMKSERLGTRWYVRQKVGGYITQIGNSASYAKYVHGDQQSSKLKAAWRRLSDVAQEQMGTITDIYNRWIAYTLKKLGL